jgi:hypothetical protein
MNRIAWNGKDIGVWVSVTLYPEGRVEVHTWIAETPSGDGTLILTGGTFRVGVANARFLRRDGNVLSFQGVADA